MLISPPLLPLYLLLLQDETLAMFYTIEMLRTVQTMHSCGIFHGNVTADKFLLRNDRREGDGWIMQWNMQGSGGWHQHGD